MAENDEVIPEGVTEIEVPPLTDENNGVTTGVDYPATAAMRIDLAMSKIQQYAAMKDFDDDFAALYTAWVTYFKAIKPLNAAGDFEGVFNIELPQE